MIRRDSRYSIKTKVFLILLMMMLPLTILIVAYSLYFVSFYNDRLAETNRNTLAVYSASIENILERLDDRMRNFVAFDNDFKLLSTTSDALNAHIYSLNIMNDYQQLINENNALCACYIINDRHQLFRATFADWFSSYNMKYSIKEFVEDLIPEDLKTVNEKWQGIVWNDCPYIYLIKGYQGTYCVYVLDVERLTIKNLYDTEDETGQVVLIADHAMLNTSDKMAESNLRFTGETGYYFSGDHNEYMVIERTLSCSDLSAAYVMPYKGYFGSISSTRQITMVCTLIFVICMIPVGHYFLKKVFFRPVDQLVDTMNEIKQGNLEKKAETEFNEKEFFEVNNTFNSMIEQIQHLKIEAYEKELNLRQTQLDYYQIQIRPHFYVNSLKSIYGLLEEKKELEARESIICLSRHLRYMLKGSALNVTLSEELQYVKNYIELQRMSMAYPPVCTIELGEHTEDFMIPAISILSFIENAIKYGMIQSKSLRIGVYVNHIISEEGFFLNIHISDNGKGFDDETLYILNQTEARPNDGHSIGIYNVIQRYNLFFGEENVLFAFSNMEGAHIDIFVREKEYHESFTGR